MICDGCHILLIFLILGKAFEVFGECAGRREAEKEIEEYLRKKEIRRKIDEKYKIDEEDEE
jgi:hypothetical protein